MVKVPLSVMAVLVESVPVVLPSPSCKVPALMVVVPVYVLVPARIMVPALDLVMPAPLLIWVTFLSVPEFQFRLVIN